MGGSESKVVHHGPMRKWDWGDYSTAFAEKILLEHAANSGEFIVRRSKKLKGYCISVLVNRDEVRHYAIVESSDGWFTIGAQIQTDGSPSQINKQLASKKCSTIPELVNFLTRPKKMAKRVFQHFGCFLLRPIPKIDTTALPEILQGVRKQAPTKSKSGVVQSPPMSPSNPNFARARYHSTAFAGEQAQRSPGAPAPPSHGKLRSGSFSVGTVGPYKKLDVSPAPATASMLPGQAMGELDQAAFDEARKERAKLRQASQQSETKAARTSSDSGDDGDSNDDATSFGRGLSGRRHTFSDSTSRETSRRLSGYLNLNPDGSAIGGGPLPDGTEHTYEYQNWQTIKRRQKEQAEKEAVDTAGDAAVVGGPAVGDVEVENPYKNAGFAAAAVDGGEEVENPYKNDGFAVGAAGSVNVEEKTGEEDPYKRDGFGPAEDIKEESPYRKDGFGDAAAASAGAEGAQPQEDPYKKGYGFAGEGNAPVVGGAGTTSTTTTDVDIATAEDVSDGDDGDDGDDEKIRPISISDALDLDSSEDEGDYGTLSHGTTLAPLSEVPERALPEGAC